LVAAFLKNSKIFKWLNAIRLFRQEEVLKNTVEETLIASLIAIRNFIRSEREIIVVVPLYPPPKGEI